MWNQDAMWANSVIPTIVGQDFKKTRDLGANTIRLIAPYLYFSGVDSSKYHARLTEVLRLAQLNGLRVILTLFDWATDEEIAASNFPMHDVYLREFANRYGQNPTILAWDIQNEPDHRYGLGHPEVRSTVIEFLKRSYAKLKEFGVRQPVSAGLYGHYLAPRDPAKAINDPEGLLQTFDFVMLHWYESPEGLKAAIGTALTNGGGKPVLLEELGTPSGGGRYTGKYSDGSCKIDRLDTASLTSQENLFKGWGSVIREFNKSLSGVVVWDLVDHSDSTAKLTDAFCPGDITGYFGLYQTNGQLKPAGAVFKMDFPLFMGQQSANSLANKIFSQTLGRRCSIEECKEPISRVVSEGTSEAALTKSIGSARERLVRQWYYGYLGRIADDGGLAYYLDKLATGNDCRMVGKFFLENVKFQGELGVVFSNSDFVTKLYIGFMGRRPDAGGFNYWLGLLNNQQTRDKMVNDFLNSPEYTARCQ